MKPTNNDVYRCIVNYIKENGYAPTIREIGKNVGISSTSTVLEYVRKLESYGVIKVKHGCARAIFIVKKSDWQKQRNIHLK